MEVPTSLVQPLQGQIVCACFYMFCRCETPICAPREKEPLVTCKTSGTATLFASSFHEMYNCTKHHTGSAVAWFTKDRATRRHLPSTEENQLGRRRQLLTIAQWNARTMERGDRPERRTALVAMELAKYNIDMAALCETMFSESGNLNDLEYSFFWSGISEGERREARVGFAIKRIS